MKTKVLILFGMIILFQNCKNSENKTIVTKVELDHKLIAELATMNELDQYTSGIPQGKYEGDWEAWYKYRDSVTRVIKLRLEEILDENGYPGYDLVGKAGASHYWNMVQHCDFDPQFQFRVLDSLKIEVDKDNARASDYGYLTDRTRINVGKKQLYGTQVDYNLTVGQAFSKPVEDSLNVNQRREKLGMEPLEVYLNDITKMHFEANKAHYDEIGLKEPKLYTYEN